jgi:hypothetical protein
MADEAISVLIGITLCRFPSRTTATNRQMESSQKLQHSLLGKIDGNFVRAGRPEPFAERYESDCMRV